MALSLCKNFLLPRKFEKGALGNNDTASTPRDFYTRDSWVYRWTQREFDL